MADPHLPSTPAGRLQAFIHHEATAGLILAAAAIAAVVFYNIEALRPAYDGLRDAKATVTIAGFGVSKPLLLWINDGLMAIFFFLVGLEIKREIVEGNLSSRHQIVLPAVAALGGMIAPALVYSWLNWNDPVLMKGWAIPAATDIAFALGALSLAGSRVPASLKIFLLTLATLDDLGAIVIIALFYTSSLSAISLVLAACVIAALFILNRLHVSRTAPYVVLGIALWLFVLKSGVHATLAGVVLGLMIPLYRKDGPVLAHGIEEALHGWVKFLILPLFAFANAGLPLDGFALATLTQSLPSGIALGLFIGKPLGIMLACGLAVALGLARLPDGCRWPHMLGVGFLAGIGFTMSLFIGSLAFDGADLANLVRVGVSAGSLAATAVGIVILTLVSRRP